MMNYKFLWPAIACMLASIGAFADEDVVIKEQIHLVSPQEMAEWKPTFNSFDDWLKRITRKEWRVLYKSETKDDYVAIFLGQDERLIIAFRRVDGLDAKNGSTSITGEDKKTVEDGKGRGWLVLETEVSTAEILLPNGGLSSSTGGNRYYLGDIWTIRKGYKGKVHIVKQDRMKEGGPWRTFLDYTFDWPVAK